MAAAPSHQYVGAEVCAMCHKTPKNGEQFQKWQASKHSQAFKTLLTPEAQKIAEAKGIKGKPSEAKECLECHETAYDAPASQLGPRFNKEERRAVRNLPRRGQGLHEDGHHKNQQKAVANGLVLLS